jgi:hypothetical protein
MTAIDAEAILRSARAAKAKPRSRLLGWISGDYDEDGSGATAAPGSLAPPPADVRREMLRLELEAQVANAQAEVGSMAADDAVEHGRSLAADDAADAGEAAANAADAPAEAVAPEAAGEPDAAAAATNGADESPPA